ncbi:MAG: 50S ribosomal protein L25 [Candidatus Pacebacteria bacterium]|nr:50S ribosomal protein L25 [Candidatus Paceibacterota bacterium]
METLEILTKTRELKKNQSNRLRAEGYVPGVVYGFKKENKNIKIESKIFKEILKKAGESTLIDLKVDDKSLGKVVISDFQIDPVSDNIIHFDLYQVRMDKKITTKVNVSFIGEAPAIKDEGGVLVKSHDVFEIRCLPSDLIHNIEVDLSQLGKIDDMVRVRDLKISDQIEIISSPDVVVVTVAAPRTEKDIEDLEEKVEEDIESVEGAEPKEGEEASTDATDVTGDNKEKKEEK